MSEAPRQIAYVLTDESINDLQTNTVQTLIERAKRAHYCNVYLRINGKDELYQADWLKHMKAASVAAVSAPQQPAAQSALSDEQVQEAMRLADEVASIAAAQYLPGYQQADEDQARAALETYLRGIGR